MSLETTNHAEGCPRPQRLGPVSPAAQTAGGALAPGCEEALLTQRLVLEEPAPLRR